MTVLVEGIRGRERQHNGVDWPVGCQLVTRCTRQTEGIGRTTLTQRAANRREATVA